MNYLDYLDLLDPTILTIIGVILVKFLIPLFKSIHLNNQQKFLFNVAKQAVTYAAQQSGMDDIQRRTKAEDNLTTWANSHHINLSKEQVRMIIESAYQFLKNGNAIDIAPYPAQSAKSDSESPKMDYEQWKAEYGNKPSEVNSGTHED